MKSGSQIAAVSIAVVGIFFSTACLFYLFFCSNIKTASNNPPVKTRFELLPFLALAFTVAALRVGPKHASWQGLIESALAVGTLDLMQLICNFKPTGYPVVLRSVYCLILGSLLSVPCVLPWTHDVLVIVRLMNAFGSPD